MMPNLFPFHNLFLYLSHSLKWIHIFSNDKLFSFPFFFSLSHPITSPFPFIFWFDNGLKIYNKCFSFLCEYLRRPGKYLERSRFVWEKCHQFYIFKLKIGIKWIKILGISEILPANCFLPVVQLINFSTITINF